jgi:hypothetical protein
MAFAIRNLTVMSYGNGFTQWHYKAGYDTIADASSDGYFENATDMLKTGDFILVSAKGAATIRMVVPSLDVVNTIGLS